jgi:hypothetical protein
MMKAGDFVEVHQMMFPTGDRWVPALVTAVTPLGIHVEAIGKHTFDKEGATMMVLRPGGNSEKIPQWR